MLRRLTLIETAAVVRDLVAVSNGRRSVVEIAGPKGAGKSTLAAVVGKMLVAYPPATGPRPEPGETGDAFQRRVEDWMLDLFEATPNGAPLVLDRGWTSIEVFRALGGRPGPSERYARIFLPCPRRGIVVLLDADDADIERARGSSDFLEAERAAWRSLVLPDAVPVLRIRRSKDRYDVG